MECKKRSMEDCHKPACVPYNLKGVPHCRNPPKINKRKQMERKYAKESHKANYETVLAQNENGESMRGIFNTANTNYRRVYDRTSASNTGLYTSNKLDKAFSELKARVDMKDPAIQMYIALRNKLTRDEKDRLEIVLAEVNRKLQSLRNAKGKIVGEKRSMAADIIEANNICDLVILEVGRVFKEKAKKSGEATEADLKVAAKTFGLPTTNVNKAELCFSLAIIMALDEKQFAQAHLSTEKMKYPRMYGGNY